MQAVSFALCPGLKRAVEACLVSFQTFTMYVYAFSRSNAPSNAGDIYPLHCPYPIYPGKTPLV